jgi:hypothetical protein
MNNERIGVVKLPLDRGRVATSTDTKKSNYLPLRFEVGMAYLHATFLVKLNKCMMNDE